MRILLALIYVQNSITMPHLAVIQLMRVIKWPRSDLDGSCMNKNVCGNKAFYSISLQKVFSHSMSTKQYFIFVTYCKRDGQIQQVLVNFQ